MINCGKYMELPEESNIVWKKLVGCDWPSQLTKQFSDMLWGPERGLFL